MTSALLVVSHDEVSSISEKSDTAIEPKKTSIIGTNTKEKAQMKHQMLQLIL